MKKNIIYSLILLLFVAGVSSCDDDTTAGFTDVTYYPDVEMSGSEVVYLGTGTEYTDAGATATENGEPIDVDVTSNVNTEVPGVYSVNYKATNVDGFSKTVRRTVIVYDANLSTEDLSGTYSADVVRNGSISYSGNPVTLTPADIPETTGIYEISDWIGGFYAVGYDYGSAYEFPGLVQINGDNEVIELSMSNPWGDPFDSVTGTYNPESGVISYSAFWLEGTYEFVVTMTK